MEIPNFSASLTVILSLGPGLCLSLSVLSPEPDRRCKQMLTEEMHEHAMPGTAGVFQCQWCPGLLF